MIEKETLTRARAKTADSDVSDTGILVGHHKRCLYYCDSPHHLYCPEKAQLIFIRLCGLGELPGRTAQIIRHGEYGAVFS